MQKVIYHGKCSDGFTGAWVLKQAYPDAEFYEGIYQEPPPDVTDRDVVLVDFSYKREIIEKMLESCKSLLILDHHVSAEADLKDLNHLKLKMVFNMKLSGAGVAWQYYFPNKRVPVLVQYIQDRDLWANKLPQTKEVAAYIFSLEQSFDLWDKMAQIESFEDGKFQNIVEQGVTLVRKQDKDVKQLVELMQRSMNIGGHEVPVANIPHTMASEAGQLMAKGNKFAANYWDTADGRIFSLRSEPGGMDVSIIAANYGGGGHKHAAGFRMPLGWEGEV